MFHRISRLGAAVLLLCGLIAGSMLVGASGEAAAQGVRVRGSDTPAHVVSQRAEEFGAVRDLCPVVVSGGTFTGKTALNWLADGSTDLVMLCFRPSADSLKEVEGKGIRLVERAIGHGGLVVITHPSNPVRNLTVDQVKKLVKGEFANWKEVGGSDRKVDVIGLADAERAGGFRFITRDFLQGAFAPDTVLVPTFRSIPLKVAQSEGAIGLIQVRNLERLVQEKMDGKIRVIPISKDENSPAVSPSRESLKKGDYPIARPFYLYMDEGKAPECVKAFFDFCTSQSPGPVASR